MTHASSAALDAQRDDDIRRILAESEYHRAYGQTAAPGPRPPTIDEIRSMSPPRLARAIEDGSISLTPEQCRRLQECGDGDLWLCAVDWEFRQRLLRESVHVVQGHNAPATVAAPGSAAVGFRRLELILSQPVKQVIEDGRLVGAKRERPAELDELPPGDAGSTRIERMLLAGSTPVHGPDGRIIGSRPAITKAELDEAAPAAIVPKVPAAAKPKTLSLTVKEAHRTGGATYDSLIDRATEASLAADVDATKLHLGASNLDELRHDAAWILASSMIDGASAAKAAATLAYGLAIMRLELAEVLMRTGAERRALEKRVSELESREGAAQGGATESDLLLLRQLVATQAERIEALEQRGYRGVWDQGETYIEGQEVTRSGCRWYCRAASTTETPGHSADWQLTAKSGARD
jgi:hypothetical protein